MDELMDANTKARRAAENLDFEEVGGDHYQPHGQTSAAHRVSPQSHPAPHADPAEPHPAQAHPAHVQTPPTFADYEDDDYDEPESFLV